MCEAFNSAILEYMDKPIISQVEGLKFYMTNRIVKLRDYMVRYDGDICPMIEKRLNFHRKDGDGWSPTWSGDKDYSIFGFSNGTDANVVNLKKKKNHVLVGSGNLLVYHVVMQFHVCDLTTEIRMSML